MKKIVLILLLLIIAAGAIIWLTYLAPRQRLQQREQALTLARDGQAAAALEILEQLDDPRDEEVMLARARCLDQLNLEPERAGGIWADLSSSENPDIQPEALYKSAWHQLNQGLPSEAIKTINALLARYPDTTFQAGAHYAWGEALARQGNPTEARGHFQSALAGGLPAREADQVRQKLGEENLKELWAGTDEFTETYRVRSGDSLGAVAGRFHTTAELLIKINGLRGSNINIGQILRVPLARFSAITSKESNRLTLLYGDNFFAVFPVGTGRNNCSPEGEFEITTKLTDPVWYSNEGEIPPGDSRNILGSRWLGFNDPYASYGIHGTTQPETIGTQSSSGCIRMLNGDVELLFDLLPRGTKVTIVR